MRTARHFDPGSVAVIAITFALFGVALWAKGFTHDLLLEAGVLLVSIKLIILGYKNSVSTESLERQLGEIRALLQGRAESRAPSSPSALPGEAGTRPDAVQPLAR